MTVQNMLTHIELLYFSFQIHFTFIEHQKVIVVIVIIDTEDRGC